MEKCVIDTSVIIEALRLKKDASYILSKIDKTDFELFISSIVVFELYSGSSTKNVGQIEAIRKIIKLFEVVEVSSEIAKRAGEIYRDNISTLQVPDYIIAATALELGASVVTLNTKHFEKVPGLQIYRS